MFIKFRELAIATIIAAVVTLPMAINASADTTKVKFNNAYATEKMRPFVKGLNFQPTTQSKKIIINKTGAQYNGPTEPFFINGIN